MSKLLAEECACCGKTDNLELSYNGTWKERKESGEPLCPCFADVRGCSYSLVIFHDSEEKLTRDKGNLHDREGKHSPRCRGCNAAYGKIHHVNCDDEKCPKCGNQILTCSCNGEYGHVFVDDKGSENYEYLNLSKQLVR